MREQSLQRAFSFERGRIQPQRKAKNVYWIEVKSREQLKWSNMAAMEFAEPIWLPS
jgi:hypothetical protein